MSVLLLFLLLLGSIPVNSTLFGERCLPLGSLNVFITISQDGNIHLWKIDKNGHRDTDHIEKLKLSSKDTRIIVDDELKILSGVYDINNDIIYFIGLIGVIGVFGVIGSPAFDGYRYLLKVKASNISFHSLQAIILTEIIGQLHFNLLSIKNTENTTDPLNTHIAD